MKFLRELNEEAKVSMADKDFERFVKYVRDDIKKAGKEDGTDAEKLEVILSMLEDVPGYESFDDAQDFAGKVLKKLKS